MSVIIGLESIARDLLDMAGATNKAGIAIVEGKSPPSLANYTDMITVGEEWLNSWAAGRSDLLQYDELPVWCLERKDFPSMVSGLIPDDGCSVRYHARFHIGAIDAGSFAADGKVWYEGPPLEVLCKAWEFSGQEERIDPVASLADIKSRLVPIASRAINKWYYERGLPQMAPFKVIAAFRADRGEIVAIRRGGFDNLVPYAYDERKGAWVERARNRWWMLGQTIEVRFHDIYISGRRVPSRLYPALWAEPDALWLCL